MKKAEMSWKSPGIFAKSKVEQEHKCHIKNTIEWIFHKPGKEQNIYIGNFYDE